MKRNIVQHIASVLVCASLAIPAKAQLNTNFGTGYFQNQYLLNPAMSGLKVGNGNVGAGYRKQGDVKGGPESIYLTADYGINNNSGLGINVVADRAGIFNTCKLMATYSYHVQLGGNEQRLHFGISALGGTLRRLNNRDHEGNPDDPALYNYNDGSMKYEMDFGVAYTDKKFNIQAALPNIMNTMGDEEKRIANTTTFFVAGSYKWMADGTEEGITVEPKIVYRGVQGNDNVLDAGAKVTLLKNVVNVFGLYHSTKNATAGAGVSLPGFGQLTVLYTTQASEFKAYSGGDLEIGLLFSF